MIVAAFATSGLAQEIAMSPNFSNQLAQIHVGVRSGRITATPRFMNRNLSSNVKSDDREESLRVDTSGFTATIEYRLSTKAFQVDVLLDRGRELRIRRTPKLPDGPAPFEFHQSPDGKLSMTVGAGAARKTTDFATLWHVFLAEPEVARNDLEPLLHLLRAGWSPSVTGHAVEEELLKQAHTARSYDRRLWRTLVDQLGDEGYAERESADRRLRDMGKVTVPFLRSLDLGALDAEQRFRVRAILRRYGTEDSDDDPEGVAEWLAADVEIWYALAARSKPAQRAVIRSQLSMLLGRPIDLRDESTGEAFESELKAIREHIDGMQRAEREPAR